MIGLDKRVAAIFDRVQAEEELRKKTLCCLCGEIAQRNGRRKARQWRPVAVCAALLVCLLCGGYWQNLYFTPSAYIDLDINPSVELTVNSLGRVIASGAYNEEGEEILQRVNLRHAKYNKAVESLLAEMDAAGYFSADTLLSVTVQAGQKEEEDTMLASLEMTIEQCSKTHHYDTITDVFAVTEEVRRCAHEKQVSPAKYLAIQQLLAVDGDADFESCAQHSVHELQRLAQEGRNGKEESGTGGHGHGRQGGHHH